MRVEAIRAYKAASTLPFQSLLTTTVDCDVYTESEAMLRYSEKLCGLYSKCDKAAIKVDMIVDALVTVILEFSKTVLRRSRKVLKGSGSALH